MKIGFVGVGAISEACIDALLTGKHARGLEVAVSPRNRERAEKLAANYKQVTVMESNQAVLDSSDIVFLGILPGQMKDVCAELTFRADHIVASLVAGFAPSLVAEIVAPATQIAQLIPLPVIAMHAGPNVICPGIPEIVDLFDGCGDTVVLDKEDQILILSCASAAMSSFFQYQNTTIDWAVSKGLDPNVAKSYATSLFKGLAVEATATSLADLPHMPAEHETPGGLNEYIRKTLTEAGAFTALENAFEHLYQTRKQKS